MLMQCLEILTIGLPFCIFKCISGLFYQQYWLVALGVIDAVINIINLLFLLICKRRLLNACLLSLVIHWLKRPGLDHKTLWEDLGNSLDVLLAFILVAFVIGTGDIVNLAPSQLILWNISVILNVLGAGSSRLTTSIQNLRPAN